MQKFCGCCGLRDRVHSKFENTLPVIPLIDDFEKLPPLSSTKEISREEYTALQNRVHALDVFLREYVVEVDCLEKLRNYNNVKNRIE